MNSKTQHTFASRFASACSEEKSREGETRVSEKFVLHLLRIECALQMEREEAWAATAVELAPKEAPEALPCSDNPLAGAAVAIAGGDPLIFPSVCLEQIRSAWRAASGGHVTGAEDVVFDKAPQDHFVSG